MQLEKKFKDKTSFSTTENEAVEILFGGNVETPMNAGTV